MNKRGQFLFIISIMSIGLFTYAYLVLVVQDYGDKNQVFGEEINGLIGKDIEFKKIEVYYRQALRNAVFEAMEESISDGEILEGRLGNKIKKRFDEKLLVNFMEVRKKKFDKEGFDVKLPSDFEIKSNFSLFVNLTSDSLVISDGKSVIGSDLMIIEDFGYDFGAFDKIYDTYSKLEDCPGGDFVDMRLCKDECEEAGKRGALYFEVGVENLGYSKPVFKFRIKKVCDLF